MEETSEEIASSKNNIFEVSNLNVYYADFRAVKDVSMEIATNEITAFIGHDNLPRIKNFCEIGNKFLKS